MRQSPPSISARPPPPPRRRASTRTFGDDAPAGPDIAQGLRVDSCLFLFSAYSATSAAADICRFPNTDSAIANTANIASTQGQISALSFLSSAWLADDVVLDPDLEAIPVFFHNSSVSVGTIAKSDSRRSVLTEASSSRPFARRISKNPWDGNWNVCARVDSASDNSLFSPAPTISTGTPFSRAVRSSTKDPTL